MSQGDGGRQGEGEPIATPPPTMMTHTTTASSKFARLARRAAVSLTVAIALSALFGTVAADTSLTAPLTPFVIETFDDGMPELIDQVELEVGDVIAAGAVDAAEQTFRGLDAELVANVASGIRGGAVPVSDENGRGAVIRMDLPDRDGARLALEDYHGLLLRVFVAPRTDDADPDEATFRLLLHDAASAKVSRPAAFYCRVDLEAERLDDGWLNLVLPFAAWRWDGGRVGDWDRANELTVVIPAGYTVLFDEIGVIPPGAATPEHTVVDKSGAIGANNDGWLGRDALNHLLPTPGLEAQGRFLLEPDHDDWAFDDLLDAVRAGREIPTAGRYVRVYTEVSTDVLSEQDAAHLVENLDRLAPFLVRLLDIGGAVDSPCPSQPPVVTIYKTHADEVALFERLGTLWNATIGAPRGPYTVAQFAGVYWVEDYGWERPTFLHEALHAALPYWAGVPFGAGSWLHESLANYLQLCVYPASMSRDEYVKLFSRNIGARGGFKPLDAITRPGDAKTSNYAQLASIIAFLLEQRGGWLPQIVNAVHDGDSLGRFCKSQGSDIETFQADWLEWGRERFAEIEPEGVPAFETPLEWQVR